MAPTAVIKDKIKSNLEIVAACICIISAIGGPCICFIVFKVQTESFQTHTEAAMASQETRISVLEAERITIARALGRLEEQSTQNQRTLERIETNLARSR